MACVNAGQYLTEWRRLLVQQLLFGADIAAFRWEQAGHWKYTCTAAEQLWLRRVSLDTAAFLHAMARVTALLVMFDARFPAVCAFHAASALGFGALRRDNAWSVERLALAVPVLASVVVFSMHEVYALGLGAAMPLLLVQFASVSSSWLLMRESVNNRLVDVGGGFGSGNGGSGGDSTTDFYLSVGSVPLLFALFWWFGENRSFSVMAGGAAVQRGGVWVAFTELSAWHKSLMLLVCIFDYVRASVAHKLLWASSPR